MAHARAAATAPTRPRPRWRGPLVVGLCFGLGYGITHRLLALQLPSLVRLGQGFEVRPFPGTTLESLRLRFGAEGQEIRGDLDPLELENKPAPDPAEPIADPQPSPQPEPDLREAPRVEAPPPPQLPSPDLPQFSPDAGLP
jgi:hypothetical protein